MRFSKNEFATSPQIFDGGMSPINSQILGQAPQQKFLISVPGWDTLYEAPLFLFKEGLRDA